MSAAKAVLALVLLGVAAWLGYSKWTTAEVDWYLGDLRQNPGDQAAYAAFERMGDRAIPRLTAELSAADDPNGRVVTVLALNAIRSEAAERLLAVLASDKDPFVASQAVAACAARRGAASAVAVAAALADARRPVRLAARRSAVEHTRGLPWWVFGQGPAAATPASPASVGGGT